MIARDLAPHSLEAEQSVLGGLMLENHALDRIADQINEQDFYDVGHRAIWRAISSLIEQGKPADVITVAEALDSRHQLEGIGGLAYLDTLARNTPSAGNIRHYAEIVRDRAALRAIGRAAAAMQATIGSPRGRTPSEIASEALAALEEVASPIQRNESEPITAAAAIGEVLLAAEDASTRRGLDTGINGWDALTLGLEPGQLCVIAARPAVGKTALGLSIARHAARTGGPAVFFSLEMSRRELATRLLAAEARVPASCLRTGPNESQWSELARAATAPGLYGLILDDRPAASVAYVRARCRRLKRQGGLALVVVDYLQLMTPADQRASRTEQVGSLSRGLKTLAKELGVPVVAMAQLNRLSESRADRRPQLSDLRDSGEIEQDADQVLLMYHASEDGDILACDLAKHRQGPTGTFWLRFDRETMRFERHHGAPPKPANLPHRGGFCE